MSGRQKKERLPVIATAGLLLLLIVLVALVACMQASDVFLTYQPVQCVKPPWQVWEENSGRVYIRAPAEEEIITHYYAAVHDIRVRNVSKILSGTMTCEACGVCPTDYRYRLTVNASAMQPLLDDGWIRET